MPGSIEPKDGSPSESNAGASPVAARRVCIGVRPALTKKLHFMVRSPTGRDTARSAVGADPEAYAVIGQFLDETLGPGVFVLEPRDTGVGEQLLPSFHLLDVRKERRIQQCPQLGVFEIARVFREIPQALGDGEGGR